MSTKDRGSSACPLIDGVSRLDLRVPTGNKRSARSTTATRFGILVMTKREPNGVNVYDNKKKNQKLMTSPSGVSEDKATALTNQLPDVTVMSSSNLAKKTQLFLFPVTRLI